MQALRCPSCGSPELDEVRPYEYKCPHCGTRFVLTTPAAPLDATPLVDVVLVQTGRMQINVIKALREVTDLELGAAKRLTDRPPGVVVHAVTPQEAGRIQERLEQAGAAVELRPA